MTGDDGDCTVSHAYFLRSQGAEFHQAAHAFAHGAIAEPGLDPPERSLRADAIGLFDVSLIVSRE